MAENYGRVFLPISVCLPDARTDETTEELKLSDSFFVNDVIIFDGRRQPEKNGCR